MSQTKNAFNNVIARYKSVLAHCRLVNACLLGSVLAIGVSTYIGFYKNAWAVELNDNINTDTAYDSVEISNGKTIYVNSSSLTVTGTLSNEGQINIVNWTDKTKLGNITANNVNTSGSFTIDNSSLEVSNTLTNSGTFLLNGSEKNYIAAKNFINSGNGEFKIDNGTITINEKITNSAKLTINNGNIDANFLEHSENILQINSGLVNIDSINVTGGEFIYQGGTLTTDRIENSSIFTMSNGVNLNLNTLVTKEHSTFGVNNSTLTLDFLDNSGNFVINADDTKESTVTIKNFHNGKTGFIQVNGDKNTSSVAHVTIENASTNYGKYQFTEGAVIDFNNVLTNLGTVEVMNTDTKVTVNGNFINGDADNQATLHIHDDDAVVLVTGDLINNNGLVGVHSGTLTINGILTNNSESKSTVDDAHSTEQEAIHVHDANLIVSTLHLNKGGLGLHAEGHGVFTNVYSKNNAYINVWDDGSFTAKTGALAGTLHINGEGLFTKNGGALDVLTLSNRVTNLGTIKVTGGGLALENLVNEGTTNNDFFTHGDVIVSGQNSYLRLGKMSAEAFHALIGAGLAESDHHENDHSTFTMLQAAVTFNDGMGIVLKGGSDLVVSKTQEEGATGNTSTIQFDSGTLFKFNGQGFNREDAVITVDGRAGTIAIANDAKFLATNLTAKTYYTLIKNVDSSLTQADVDKTGWQQDVEALGTTDRMLEDANILYVPESDKQYGDSTTNDIILVSGGVTDKNFGVDEEIFENMKDLWEDGKNDKDSENAGTGFVSGAADKTEILDDAEAGKTLESAFNVAVTGGVAGMTTDASDIASQAVNHRIDGVRAEAGDYYEDISATDWGLWAIPLYQQSQVRDMKIGVNSGGYDSYITGAIIGLDRKKDVWTCGLAFGLGFGEAESVGNYASTKTQLDFWSAIVYGGYHKGNFEFKGDFTYTSTRSEITQDNPYHLVSMANISADVDSQLYSLGATASYKMQGYNIDLTPHIGVRYRAYHQDSFTSTLGGRDLFHVHDGHMETWLVPVGVTFSDTFLYNEWLITPRLDVSFTAVFGDTTIMNRVNIAGTGDDVNSFGTTSIEADALDYGIASLSLGVGAKKDDWSFGLDFDFQKSDRREAQAVFARAAYRF